MLRMDTRTRMYKIAQDCTRLYKHSHVHFSRPESSRPAQGASQGWHTATNWATHPWSRPLRCSSQQTCEMCCGSPPGGSPAIIGQSWSPYWSPMVTEPVLLFSEPRPCKTPIQSKVCDILLQQRVLWEQMKATIISYRKMFIIVYPCAIISP